MSQKTAPATKPTTTQSWRSLYPVHPCADVFPMMTDAEIDALAQDIKANDLRDQDRVSGIPGSIRSRSWVPSLSGISIGITCCSMGGIVSRQSNDSGNT